MTIKVTSKRFGSLAMLLSSAGLAVAVGSYPRRWVFLTRRGLEVFN